MTEDKRPVLLMAFLLFVICFIYDNGTDLDRHGAYNRIILFLFMIIWTGLTVFFNYLWKCLKRRPFATIGVICIIITVSYLKITYTLNNSCAGWEDGFKNSKITNHEKSKCKIYPPKICYYQIFNGVFDVSRLLHDTCDNMPTNKFSNNEKYLTDKTARIIGYPRTEKWKIFPDSTHGVMNKRVMKEIINMEDPKIDKKIKERIEVTTNFYKNPPVVDIDLKRDEKLVRERGRVFKKYKDEVLTKNVLYLFIDSVSRVNFKIKLPKFWNWISQFYRDSDSQKNTDEKIETFQFLKYHGVGKYTAFNMIPAFFGVYNIYYAGKHFLINYKQRGYITGQSLNFCGREVFDIDGGAIKRMKWASFDHEMQSFFCEGNFTPYDQPNPIMMGTNSIRRRCMYNKNTTWFSLEYMRQFFVKYANEPKFFRLGLVDAHEGTTEVVKYSDDLLVEFFDKFKRDGFLDNTLMVIHSDHGFSMPGPFSLMELEDYEHEVVLPSYFLLVPKSLKYFDQIRDNLIHNENALITPFTAYNNILTILGSGDDDILFSMEDLHDVFSQKISDERTCKNTFYNYDYFYGKEYRCRCNE